MPDSGLFITLTIRDLNGGKVLVLKKVGLEYGLRRVEEVMQDKYGRRGVRRREEVYIPPLIDIFREEDAI